jgi:hypothetical protein
MKNMLALRRWIFAVSVLALMICNVACSNGPTSAATEPGSASLAHDKPPTPSTGGR